MTDDNKPLMMESRAERICEREDDVERERYVCEEDMVDGKRESR